MELTWLDPARLDDRDVAEAVALAEAARQVDAPHDIAPTVTSFSSNLRHGWDGDPPMTALARDERGRAVGLLVVNYPRWDNTHLGFVSVTVDPPLRRQGIGRRLFDLGLARVRADGRTLVLAESYHDSPGEAFLKSLGFDRASEAVQRRQDLTTIDWPALDKEYQEAEAHAGGYELIRIAGRTPDDLIDDIARMTAAINDAPTDDLDIEDEIFTPERIRAFESAQLGRGRRIYRVVARERATGGLAGHTMVGVEADRPWQSGQFDTSVLRAHRGHRLGLLLKTDMLRWLAEAEPQLRTLDTWNAASNAHMIRVNELLGYRVIVKETEWQKHL